MTNHFLAATYIQGYITNPALGNLNNETGLSFIRKFIPKLVGIAFVIGAIVFFFMLIVGAIQWISSGGDKQALETARARITSALIGLVILFAIFAIIKLLELIFGVSILALDIVGLVIQ